LLKSKKKGFAGREFLWSFKRRKKKVEEEGRKKYRN
jgi:hypothetical protein